MPNIREDFSAVYFDNDGLKEVRGLVIHSMDGTYQGSIAWFRNPQNPGASAHYLISQDGEITQMVREKDAAYHAGIYDQGKAPNFLLPNPNWYTIGIEFEDRKDRNWKYPKKQREAGAWLVELLMKRYKIPQKHVFLHRDLNPSRRSDPIGEFSFDWLFDTPDDLPSLPIADKTQRIEQIVIDSYMALTNHGPSDNEKTWRLQNWENTRVFLESLTGDGRFHEKYVKPDLEKQKEDLEKLYRTQLLEKDQFWQSKFDTAKDNALKLATKTELLMRFFGLGKTNSTENA